ncbi:MAG TPA: nuclear transport factor 2 family protein [Ilumatobacteraceae bacterium]|nr:nuclear transport factor 2 family protein [Ilumatobacteraceae bacterium]
MLDADRSELSTHVVGRRGLIAGGAGLFVGATALVASSDAAAAEVETSPGRPVPADVYADICQLKANYVTATDSLPFPDSGDRALALYRATYAEDAQVSAGYDPAAPDFLVHGPDELFQVLQAGLAPFRASQHNVGVIHVSLSDLSKPRGQLAIITAHVLVTLVSIEGLGLTRIVATYHDEAQRRGRGRWQVTKSFAQYLATETAERVLP